MGLRAIAVGAGAYARNLRYAGFATVVALAVYAAVAREPVTKTDVAVIALGDLPAQGQNTYSKILSGGPFPYDRDGAVFANRERLLPSEKRGYYREYTVKLPRYRDRGAARIVCGGRKPTQPDRCYYTADHYASYRLIVLD